MSSDIENPAPKRVLIVDDHPIVRLGIRQMLSSQRDLTICGEADSAPAALQMAAQARPDLALVDLSLLQGTSLEVIRSLRETVSGLKVLVISMHDEALYAERVLRAGASGYIMKQAAIDGLVDAIRQVLAGRIFVSAKVAQSVLRQLGPDEVTPVGALANLTDRELQVFELIGRGRSSAEIAQQLDVSIKTIETYRANIKSKLTLRDAADLIRFAATWIAGL